MMRRLFQSQVFTFITVPFLMLFCKFYGILDVISSGKEKNLLDEFYYECISNL